jgi:hypothetical protein
VKNSDQSYKVLDDTGYPRGLLPAKPWVDLNVVNRLLGPAGTIVSGNSFFNPFIWDGIHYFTAEYDSEGRVSSAKEWDSDNLVRFAWDGDRLQEITAFHGQDHEAYYRRALSYSGPHITVEEYKSGSHSGRIRYNYSKDTLASAKVDDGGVHDGKTWVAHFAEEMPA